MSDRRRGRGAAAAAAAAAEDAGVGAGAAQAGPSAAVIAQEQGSANPVSAAAVAQGAAAGAASAALPIAVAPVAAAAAGAAGAVAQAPVVAAPAAADVQSAMEQMLSKYPRKFKPAAGRTAYIGPDVFPSPESIFDSRSGDLAAQWIFQTRQVLQEYQATHRGAPRNVRAAEPVLDAVAWSLFYALAHYEYAAFLHAFWKGRRAPRRVANEEAAASQYEAEGAPVSGYLDPSRGGELQSIVAIIGEYPRSAATFGLRSDNGLTIDINEAQLRKFVMSGPEREVFQLAGAPPLGSFGGEGEVQESRGFKGLNRSAYLREMSQQRPRGANYAMPAPGENILQEMGPEDLEVRAAAAIHGAILAAQRTAPGALEAAKQKMAQAGAFVASGLSRAWSYIRPGPAVAAAGVGAPLALADPAAAAAATNVPMALAAPVAQRPVLPPLPAFIGAPGAAAAAAAPAAATGQKRRVPSNTTNRGEPGAKRRANGNNNNSNNEGYEPDPEAEGGRRRKTRRSRKRKQSRRRSSRAAKRH